jgi:hypothetical protein
MMKEMIGENNLFLKKTESFGRLGNEFKNFTSSKILAKITDMKRVKVAKIEGMAKIERKSRK